MQVLFIRQCFIMSLLVWASSSALADEDKPDSAIPWYNLEILETPFAFATQYADTTHLGFQLYDFSFPGDPFIANKGNVGHVSRQLQFTPGLSGNFPLYRSDPYLHYRFMHDHLRFYRPEHVYTDLFYVTGSDREQLFYGKHAQRLHERVYATGNYRIINSPGSFSRLGARNSNVYFTLDYQSPDDRYQALASIVSNRMENQESGGLKNHLAYEENPVRDSVFMFNAMSRHRETAIHLNHFYRTGFFINSQSAEEDTVQNFVNLGRINHNFSYIRRSFVFEEGAPPVAFYAIEPQIPTSTFDSTLVQTLENQFSWSNFPQERDGASFPFNFRLSLTHRFVNIQQPLFVDQEEEEGADAYTMQVRTYNQFIPGVAIESDRNRLLSFNGYTRMVIGGYNDEDFELGGNLFLGRQNDNSRVQASVFFYLREAPYFMSHLSGNYISWDRTFDKQNILRFSGKWLHSLVDVEASYYLLSNMVFLNSEALPEQNERAFSVMTAGVSASPGIWFLRSRHRVMLQLTSSDHFERFPVLISYHSVYADLSLFDRALLAHVGFDLTYNAPYKPMAYMPVARQFYTQDGYNSGHNILLDVFLTAKIKRTRFLLKLQNIAGLLIPGPPVYTIPFYPQPEMAFKFGVSWMFFN